TLRRLVRDDAIAPEAVAEQAVPPLVGGEGVAAAGDEAEDVVEILAREIAVGRRPGDFAIERVGGKGFGARHADDVLGEDVEPARARLLAIERAGADGGDGGAALQHLETIAGN